MGYWYCPENPTREIETLSKEEAKGKIKCNECPVSVRRNCYGPLERKNLNISIRRYPLAAEASVNSFMESLRTVEAEIKSLREYDAGKIIDICLKLQKDLLLFMTEAIRQLTI